MQIINEEPGRQLGWHTSLNNLITQLFLKFRVIFIFFFISAIVGTAVGTVFIPAKEWSIFKLYSGIVLSGQSPSWPATYFILRLLVALFFESLVITIPLFLFLFYTYKKETKTLYDKKYIRGLKLLPPRDLIASINLNK